MASARVARLRAPTLTIAALAAATTALHLRDPHQGGSWGLCPLQALTGIYCPGCGGLRAVHDLTDGRVGEALSSNALVTLAIPFGAIALMVWFLSAWRGAPIAGIWRPSAVVKHRLWVLLAVAAGIFAVARNLPWGAALAP